MLRSLFSAISGLRANQTMIDVTGNNVANANTVGYTRQEATLVAADPLALGTSAWERPDLVERRASREAAPGAVATRIGRETPSRPAGRSRARRSAAWSSPARRCRGSGASRG